MKRVSQHGLRALAVRAASVTIMGWSSAVWAQQPTFVAKPCSAAFGEFDSQTRDIAKCGTVTVAQDRGAPNTPGLQPVVLPVVIYAGPGARGTPVLFLAGGPGESAIDASQK